MIKIPCRSLLIFCIYLVLWTTSAFSEVYTADELERINTEVTEFIETYKEQQFVSVSEELLKQIKQNRKAIWAYYNPTTDTPWLENINQTYKYQFALSHIWEYHLKVGSQDEVKEELVRLLILYCDDSEMYVHLAYSFSQANIWGKDVEKVFSDHLETKKRPLAIRTTALEMLLEYADLNTYSPYISGIINEQPDILQKFQWFTRFTNHGNRLFTLTHQNRELVLKCGFDLLITYSQSNRNLGYFVARQLGFILKVPNTFAPNQDEPKYREAHGLNDLFFQDTVTNAITWYQENKL